MSIENNKSGKESKKIYDRATKVEILFSVNHILFMYQLLTEVT